MGWRSPSVDGSLTPGYHPSVDGRPYRARPQQLLIVEASNKVLTIKLIDLCIKSSFAKGDPFKSKIVLQNKTLFVSHYSVGRERVDFNFLPDFFHQQKNLYFVVKTEARIILLSDVLNKVGDLLEQWIGR